MKRRKVVKEMEKKYMEKLIGKYCKFVIKEPGEDRANVVTGILEDVDYKDGFILVDSSEGLGCLRINTIIAIKPRRRHFTEEDVSWERSEKSSVWKCSATENLPATRQKPRLLPGVLPSLNLGYGLFEDQKTAPVQRSRNSLAASRRTRQAVQLELESAEFLFV